MFEELSLKEKVQNITYLESRPWGDFFCFGQNVDCTAKVLILNPGESLSLQYHRHRAQLYYIISEGIEVSQSDIPFPDGEKVDKEVWIKEHVKTHFGRPGDLFFFDIGVVHSVRNPDYNNDGEKGYITEVAYGANDELDIVRLRDRYGRENK
jgi:hypothetical protein